MKLIVPFPAGGPTELVGREAANILREELKQPVIVENCPDGNGVLGHSVLAKSPADGYTIGLLVITVSIAPHLGNAPFDTFKDFAPISNMVSMTPIIVANNNAPFNNLSELTTYAKTNPEKLAYGTHGVATAKESGYPGLVVSPWFGLGAPAGVPADILQKMHAAIAKGLNTKEVQDKFAAIGASVHSSKSPAEFSDYIKSEYERWGKVIKAADVKAE
ncbi:hypothetical protein C5F52_10450 [Limnohabitans sp. TS-CS-82]|nr:hypothetical protein C5F52_10450 [Limnohabitans sp. TS-CS-82]